jgi:hypothetical protein
MIFPGARVIEIIPPMPCAIWSKLGRLLPQTMPGLIWRGFS